MAAETFCRFFKFGYCKYRNFCRKNHVSELCEDENCDGSVCEKRHPKKCFYFHELHRCKFGDYCLYSHNLTQASSAVKDNLETKVKNLEKRIEDLEKERRALMDDLRSLESTFKKYQVAFTNENSGMVTPLSNMDLLSTESLINVNGNCNEVRIFEKDGKALAAAVGDGLLGSFPPWSFKTP